MADWKQWQATTDTVAQIAANVLYEVVADSPVPSGPRRYATGPIEWWLLSTDGTVVAANTGDVETCLVFTVVGPDAILSVAQPLPPESSYDASHDIDMFRQGLMTAAPAMLAGTSDARLITLAVSGLPLGQRVAVGGLAIWVDKDRSTGLFTVDIANPGGPYDAVVLATDGHGDTVSARGEAQKDGTLRMVLGPGADLSPVVQRLSAALTVPAPVYERLTSERRAQVRAGLPSFLEQPAARR
jgi:hypothetical protein